MANPFVHVELHTHDLDKAKTFYKALFPWELTDMPMPQGGAYTMIGVGEGTGGGMMKHPVPKAPPAWLAYVQVDDVAATTRKARKLGAKILQDSVEVPSYGWFSVIEDPTGAVLGLWQGRGQK